MKKIPLWYLIDDDADDQEIFSMALENVAGDVQCIMAANGEEGIVKLRSNPVAPDIIFLDLNMPRMNGIECLKEIRKLHHLKDVSIIIYSTSDGNGVRDLTLGLGADGFIIKPASIAELTNMLARILTSGGKGFKTRQN